MRVHVSTHKRQKQSEVRRVRNRATLTSLRTLLKKARADLAAGNLESAQTSTVSAISALDKAGGKGVIHKNKASRLTSRLNRSRHLVSQAKALKK